MKQNRWSAEEKNLLIENYNKLSNEDLLKLLPDRSYQSIYKKARCLGFYKDKRIEFINRSLARKGEKSTNWKGGKKKTNKGYIQVLDPDNPRADRCGYVMEHIYVFEKATGINVPYNCVIHHLDGNKQNNDISNLCMMEFGAHTTYHNYERRKK